MTKSEEIIKQVLGEEDFNGDVISMLDEWMSYLEDNLNFPFEAKVKLFSPSNVFKTGDIVKVLHLETFEGQAGILMKVKFERKNYIEVLDELTVIDKKSENYAIVEAYKDWFDNL